MAELWSVQKRPDAAAAALDKVLALDAGNRPAFQQLRALHAAASNWRAYADLCLLFAPHAEPEERLALLKEVAVLREQRLGEKHMASLAWNRVLGEAPGDEQALAECWRLAQEGKDQDTLAVVLEDAADKARGMVRARLLLKLGELLDAPPLDDAEGAENAIRRALEADPANPEALDALAGLFKRRGRIQELVITLEQKLEAAAGLDEKKALLLEVSRLYDEVAPRRRRGGGRAPAHPRAGRRRPGRPRGAGGDLPARAPLGRAGRGAGPGPRPGPRRRRAPRLAAADRRPQRERDRRRRGGGGGLPDRARRSTTATPRPWPGWSGSTPSSTASPS